MNEWWLHGAFALGGGLGSMARYLLTSAVTHRFPLSTLLVNVLGSGLLGFLLAALTGPGNDAVAPEQLRLGIGFCGGFTTFSSFAYQSFDLRRNNTLAHAAVNVFLNLLLCLLALLAGRWLGEVLL